MKTAQTLLALTALALLMPFVAAQSATGPTLGGQLVLNVTKYYPFPAEPGQYIDVWFDVINDGPDAVNDVTCEFEPNYPFSLDPTASVVQTVKQLQGRQGWLLKYKVLVNAGAVEGDNELKIRCKTEHVDWIEQKIIVSVRSPTALVSITSLDVEPAVVPLAGRVQVKMRVENPGDTIVKDLTASLDLSSTTTPFAAVESGAERKVKQILPGESAELTFDLVALADAEPKIHKLPLSLTWSSTLGSSFSKMEYIAITVGQKPYLSIGLDSTDIVLAGKTGNVVIRVANAGPVSAKFARVSLQPNGYQLLSSGQVYVGNIDADGVETAEFKLAASPDGNALPLKLLVDYEDANGQKYTDAKEISVKLYTEEEAYKLGLIQKPDYTLVYALVAIALIFALYRIIQWALRKRR